MTGHWVREADGSRTSETWLTIGTAMVGVGLAADEHETTMFEIMLMTNLDGMITLTKLPGGKRVVDYPAIELGEGYVVFVNPDQDPREIRYTRSNTRLEIRVSGSSGDRTGTWTLAPRPSVPVLEAADRAFSDDSRARGAAAWVDAFEPRGVLWTRRGGRVEGAAAIGAVIGRALLGTRLTRTPVMSALSGAGDVGLTMGVYHVTRDVPDRRSPEYVDGSYATIWRRDAGGTWRAALDVGSP